MGALKTKLKLSSDAIEQIRIGQGTENRKKEDPDEKWSNLCRERQRCHLYKWMVSKGSGQLLDIYRRDGEDGIHRFANEVLPPWLYNEGVIPENLKLEDYVKWRKFMHANLAGGDDISQPEILDSIGGSFTEHTALWRLSKRGVDGETLIHLLLSEDDARCTAIAKIILGMFPGLAVDIYEGEEFYGQSPLHLAIVHDDYSTVQVLIEAGADISQRATGQFFLPEDQKQASKLKSTNYAGFAYYGEYPLAFAASFGNKDIYDYLIQRGANPNAQDSFGNTVLHMCVINNSIEMYSYAVRHWAKPADVNICNNAGYTPLTLATILGRREIFEAMLELTKVEFWRFSDMTYSVYPLNTLDTIRCDGSTNWDSALMRVVNGTTTDHLEIVGCDVVQRLLDDKWRLFGERKMYERLAFHIFHLLCVSVAIYTRSYTEAEMLLRSTSPMDYIRYSSEIGTLICCLVYLFYQQSSEIRAQGLNSYLRSLHQAPEKPINLAANFIVLLCIPCRLANLYTAEETFLVLALPGFWISLLFFAKGFLMTGPFVVMIYSMITGDMVRFGIICLIFLISFSQSFYFLGKDIGVKQTIKYGTCDNDYDSPIRDYEVYWETALSLFRMCMGGYDYEKLFCAAYQPLVKLLFVLFIIVMPIMLINMLIAMMGNTYERVISHAKKAWRQQWAQIVVLLERSLDKKKLSDLQAEYSIKLNDDRFDDSPESNTTEVRGLMVIKQTRQTRAKQRKRATAAWKRLSRKALAMLRSHGVERTRYSLHRGATVTESRPPSGVAGNLLQLSQSRASQNGSATIGSRDCRTPSQQLEDSHKKAMHVVNTMKRSRTSPLVPAVEPASESPKMLIHNQHSVVKHQPLDQNALIRRLSTLEPELQTQETQYSNYGQGTPQSTSGIIISTEMKVTDAPHAQQLSSPCSISDPHAIDTILAGDATPEGSTSLKTSPGFGQMQLMTVEHLPNRSQQKSSRQRLPSRKVDVALFHRRATPDQLLSESGAGSGLASPATAATSPLSGSADGSATTVFDGSMDGEKAKADNSSKEQKAGGVAK